LSVTGVNRGVIKISYSPARSVRSDDFRFAFATN
jgi:hypothetical protein